MVFYCGWHICASILLVRACYEKTYPKNIIVIRRLNIFFQHLMPWSNLIVHHCRVSCWPRFYSLISVETIHTFEWSTPQEMLWEDLDKTNGNVYSLETLNHFVCLCHRREITPKTTRRYICISFLYILIVNYFYLELLTYRNLQEMS